MASHQLAQGLAGLGRNGDSMLVHMTPDEVHGLQSLAMAQGGSLTINPHTGLPEASFLGGLFKAVAPIAAGVALGPAGFGLFESALGAGLAVGAGAYALTGNPMEALSAGLGGAGGFNLGSNLKAFGTVDPTQAVETIAKENPVGFGTANTLNAATEAERAAFGNVASDVAGNVAQDTIAKAPLSGFESAAQGVQKIMQPGGISDYANYVKSIGGSPWMDAATVGMPIMKAAMEKEPLKPFTDDSYQMKYEGPYKPQDRQVRMPTLEEQQQLAAAGSPEYSYFGVSNPYPGFTAAYADGGSISTGGIRDLYGQPDDQADGAVLSQDGYGLGRLGRMAEGGMAYAGGGAIAFDNGGAIEQIYSPSSAAQASYAVAPTDLSQVAKLGQAPADSNIMQGLMSGMAGLTGLQQQTQNAISDPLGRMTGSQINAMNPAMGAFGYPQSQNTAPWFASLFGGLFNKQANQANQAPALTMQDYINAAQRTYNTQANPIGLASGAEQQYFDQINPQEPKVQAAQGGIMGLREGGKPTQGGYLDGPGDGMSDSIPATIADKQPARLADGEFVVPADVVSHLGNGSTKAGAKHLYKMMDKVRRARTGTTKQGRQINPNKFMPA